jgi:hypothetical protein
MPLDAPPHPGDGSTSTVKAGRWGLVALGRRRCWSTRHPGYTATDGAGGSGYADRSSGFSSLNCHFRSLFLSASRLYACSVREASAAAIFRNPASGYRKPDAQIVQADDTIRQRAKRRGSVHVCGAPGVRKAECPCGG